MRALPEPIRLVAGREVRQGLRSRAFRLSVVVTMLMVGGIGLLSRVLAGADGGESGRSYDVGLIGGGPTIETALTTAAAASGVDVTVRRFRSTDELGDALGQGNVDAGLVAGPNGLSDGQLLAAGTVDEQLHSVVEQARLLVVGAERAAAAGLNAAQQAALFAPLPPLVVRSPTGKAGADNPTNPAGRAGASGVASVAVIGLFLAVTLYGGAVMNGVLQEKASRVVEVVLSAVTPGQLLVGKILGIGLLGLGQMAGLGVVALAVTQLGGGPSLPSSTATTIALAVGWFVLGYALYASLFAMAGSLVSRQEDAQAAATPVSLVMTGAYVVALVAVLPNPDGVAAKVCTFLPLTAPTTVLVRVALGAVPLWQVGLSAVLTGAAVVLVVRLAARVYAGSALHTGARLRWREALRAGRV